MIEVYGALMLHNAGQQITEDGLKKVIQSVGASVDDGKIKSLVAALEGKNIDELIQQTAVVSAPAGKEEKKEEEKKEDEGKKAEEASAGLSSLFG